MKLVPVLVLTLLLAAPGWADTFRGTIVYTITSIDILYAEQGFTTGLSVGDTFSGAYVYDSPTVDVHLPDVSSALHVFRGYIFLPDAPDLFIRERFFFPLIDGFAFTVQNGHVTNLHVDEEDAGLSHAHLDWGRGGSVFFDVNGFNPSGTQAYIFGRLRVYNPSSVPEPGSAWLLSGGVIALLALRRRAIGLTRR